VTPVDADAAAGKAAADASTDSASKETSDE
jgi:hypothetical protein